jgi:ATP-binding cassette subfamily B protein
MGGRRGMTGEKAKDFGGSMKKLLSYMKQYRLRLFIMIFCAIGGTVFTIVGPRILGRATTELFAGIMAKIAGTGGINYTKIGQILFSVMGLYGLSALFSLVQGFLMTGISNDVTYRLRKDISVKINELPLRYYESRTTGEILSRVTNDVDTLQNGVNQSVTQLITSATTLVGVLIMMLSINVWMTLAALLILPVSMIIIAFVMRHSQKYFFGQQKYLGEVNGQIEEVYGGQMIVKAFNKEEDSIEEFGKVNQELYNTAWKSHFFGSMMQPVMNFVGNLGYVMVAILGGYMVIRGSIQVGDIQSFFQYIRSFMQPITQIAQVTNMLQSSAAAAERVFEFLEEPVEEDTAKEGMDAKRLRGNVQFDHVRFGYDPEKIIIHDFSADVKEGQKIAIVGPTGAGKTTMVKLLMRYYDVNSGAIRVDGVDIRDFERSNLREMFGMVLQDTWLFSGTIMENIRYGRLDATDEEVIAAAKAAHVHTFIMQQPAGYQMVLNEETSNISQGQKQLLTIARAILADNKILILDEATSSVDTRTEIEIQKAMDALMKGRTSFVIAHRLSTIRDADLILFMKDGDIAEMGTHEQLLAKGGLYADMYNSQFEKLSDISA